MNSVILHLSLINDIGPATLAGLIALCDRGTIYGDSLEIFYKFSAADFENYGKLGGPLAQRIVKELACQRKLDEERNLMVKHGIAYITLLDPAYPPLLKNIHMPPPVLYIKGEADWCSFQQLSIVGARIGDVYGQTVLSSYIPEFVKAGWGIVSGGALGIDTMAHRLTLESGGCTGAILGSGLLQLYPRENKELFKKIADTGGYVMSPFPLRMEPRPGSFPARNRIIAGLTRGCVVVQAAEKSGALITARFAMDEGREVFAVPGRIDNPLSAGCHALIAQGAAIASSASSVLDTLTDFAGGPARSAKRTDAVIKPVAAQEIQMTIPVAPKEQTPRDQLYALCFEPISLDDLIEKSGMTAMAVQDHLWSLMLDGKVSQSVLGLWQRA